MATLPTDSTDFVTMLNAFWIITVATLLCFPVTIFEIVIGYQLGWLCVPVLTLGKTVGAIFAFYVGNFLFKSDLFNIEGDDEQSIRMRAISCAMKHRPYKFAFLLRLSPFPASFKSYGAVPLAVPFAPFVISTVVCSFFFSALSVYIAMCIRDVGGLFDPDTGKLRQPDSWTNMIMMILVALLIIGLSIWAIRDVKKEIDRLMEGRGTASSTAEEVEHLKAQDNGAVSHSSSSDVDHVDNMQGLFIDSNNDHPLLLGTNNNDALNHYDALSQNQEKDKSKGLTVEPSTTAAPSSFEPETVGKSSFE